MVKSLRDMSPIPSYCRIRESFHGRIAGLERIPALSDIADSLLSRHGMPTKRWLASLRRHTMSLKSFRCHNLSRFRHGVTACELQESGKGPAFSVLCDLGGFNVP